MTAPKHYDLARMYASSTGTGTITLGATSPGFLSFADAGVQDGDYITYAIEEGNNREVGRGTYTAAGTTLTRTVLASTNNKNPISLGGNAQVYITFAAEDLAISQMRDVDASITPATGSILVYDAGTEPVLVQKTAYDSTGNSPTMTLASAPTVGNTIVILISGWCSVSCPGFSSIAGGGAGGTICTVLTRKVQAGDGASYNVTTGVMSYLTTGVIMEISGSCIASVTKFTPTVVGNSFSQSFAVASDTLAFVFYDIPTGSREPSSVTGGTLLSKIGWFVESCTCVAITASGTVTVNYSASLPASDAYLVTLAPNPCWVPTSFAKLMSDYTASGGDSGSTTGSLTLSPGTGTDPVFGQTAHGYIAGGVGSLTPNTYNGQTITGCYSIPGNDVLLIVSGTVSTNWFTHVSIPGIGTQALADAVSVSTSVFAGNTVYNFAAVGTVGSGALTFT